MLILIAGPYRSGTDDDPEKMAANLRRLEEAPWPLFRSGQALMENRGLEFQPPVVDEPYE